MRLPERPRISEQCLRLAAAAEAARAAAGVDPTVQGCAGARPTPPAPADGAERAAPSAATLRPPSI